MYDADYKYSVEVSTQMSFAAGAFVIQHPDKSKDKMSVYFASMNGVLNIYRSLLSADPHAHLEYFDDLLKKRERGTLFEQVEKVASKKCL